jgi:predicted PolB exonuclease-like 3'-5' exonuclease
LENVKLCQFASCDFLRKDGSVSVPFPCVRAVEMIDSLAEDFKTRFSDFRSHATNIRVFDNPSPLKSQMLQKKLKLELIKLQQHDSTLLSSFNQEALITFYASLPLSRFSDLRKLARNLASVSGSTYTCEQAFSRMKQNKSKFRSRITDVHAHDVMQIVISEMEPNINSLAEQRKAQVSH